MTNCKKFYRPTCDEARLLMVLIWAGTPGINDEERQLFQAHLNECQACSKEYEKTKELMSLVKNHWGSISLETQKLLEQAGHKVTEPSHISSHRGHPITVKESWQNLCKRCPDLTENKENLKIFPLILRISAVAACLAFVFISWFIFSNSSKQHTLPQVSSNGQVASALTSSVKIEFVRPSGNTVIAADQKIISGNELKTLLINGKHQIIMNVGTSLSIEPLIANTQIGCLVKLYAGEIHTHVEHDGNPFVVGTTNGKAVITGTIFDVKATDGSTTLVVSKGTVKFESKNGVVQVVGGQMSEIVGQSMPSIPLSCNTSELTAWATGYKVNTMFAIAESNTNPWSLPLSFGEKPIVLAETDYKQWIEEKREWFKQQFPWIFELKDALGREGIEVDYPDLLIKTGDVWQFVCLKAVPTRFSVPDLGSLLKAAYYYGFDKEWLLKNVPTAKIVQNKFLPLQNPTGLSAFAQCLKYVTDKEKTLPPFYLVEACKYLAETRSLIWFAINDKKSNLMDKQQIEVLDLLQHEVTTTYNYKNDDLYPREEPKPLCNIIYNELVNRIIEDIEIIKKDEERIRSILIIHKSKQKDP